MIDPSKELGFSTGSIEQDTRILQDFNIDLNYIPHHSLSVGQFKLPLTEEGLRSSAMLDTIERSFIGRTFGDHRDIGIQVRGTWEYVDYWLGIFNGSGQNQLDVNDYKDISGRIVLKPFKGDERKRGVAIHSKNIADGKIDYLVGVYNPTTRAADNTINTMLYMARASYYPFGPYVSYKESDLEYTESFKAHIGGGIGFEQIGQNESDDDEDEIDQTQLLGEFGFKYRGLSLLAEYHNRKRKVLDPLEAADLGTAVSANESLHDQGFFVQGGYFVIPKKLEIAGRYELIDFGRQNPESGTLGLVDNKRFYTAGLNYFFKDRDHKIQINYIHREEELSGAFFGDNDENVFLTQYQIYF